MAYGEIRRIAILLLETGKKSDMDNNTSNHLLKTRSLSEVKIPISLGMEPLSPMPSILFWQQSMRNNMNIEIQISALENFEHSTVQQYRS